MTSLTSPGYVLAVDDTPDNLLLIKIALEREGHQVVLTHDGPSALAQIQRSPPDLIVLDVMMPGMSGYEVTEHLRQDSTLPYIPILLITAHEQSSVVRGLDLGADDFIRKPVKIDELLARVRSLLRLKQTINQRESFVSHLSHDLRTPLVAAERVLTMVQEESYGNVSPPVKEVLGHVIRNNHNLLEMLNTLLEVHCYEVGEKSLSFIPFDLKELAQEVVQELGPLAEEKGLSLGLGWETELQEVKGDRLELRRVLTNLVGNAIKFTDVGSIDIQVRQAAQYLELTFTDSGIGIPVEDQQQVFERYRQGKHKRSGSGLGLHLCQQIIQAHHGTITLKSAVGEGSEFKVCLPIELICD